MSKTSTPKQRRIQFQSRDLEFPTDPTFREYRAVEDITGVTASEIMSGTAGLWILPALAIVALMRSQPGITRDQLDKVLDLDPSEIVITGTEQEEDEKDPPEEAVEEAAEDKKKSTGTRSTRATQEQSGTPDSPTSSPEQQENPTT